MVAYQRRNTGYPVLAIIRGEVWPRGGFESGNSLPSLGHLPRFQLKVLKWTENPFAWRNFGPAPEIGTLSEATPKSEGETFLTL